MLAIETRGLCKAYRGRNVVDGLDMHVARGDIYGFVGRNGAGKSTTMKMICGMIRPTRGEVRLLDRLVADPSGSAEYSEAVRIGALVESPGLYPNMTAFDNMRCKVIALGIVDDVGEIEQLLSVVGLGSAGGKRTENYSMGMKQRLGLALAMLGSPDVLLLDEPMNGLDPEGVREMRNLIIRLNEQRGITVVVSSHVLEQLGKMATRYGVIREGRMVREMSAAEVDQECSDFLQLEAANPTLALAVLQERFAGLRFQSMPDGAIRVFGGADAGAVGAALNEQGIAVRGLYAHRRDLEEFFVEMMGAEYRG